ncbi:MAG: hypothetical protein BJ554DRAFT_8354 [Olpidium bornovanus]|uniref:C2H2-type domain-containing protein n=1 Tax=Olpidium bornovanus TaxID=278681 RepID=A0A8H7ZV25_9FUNG|nr:MAG: hypothetical protein BJ554DRAFT_8354 [Olpidium bornovanus]
MLPGPHSTLLVPPPQHRHHQPLPFHHHHHYIHHHPRDRPLPSSPPPAPASSAAAAAAAYEAALLDDLGCGLSSLVQPLLGGAYGVGVAEGPPGADLLPRNLGVLAGSDDPLGCRAPPVPRGALAHHASLPDIFVALVDDDEDPHQPVVAPRFAFDRSSVSGSLGVNFRECRDTLSIDGESSAGDFPDDVSDFCSVGMPSPLLEPVGQLGGDPYDCVSNFQALALTAEQSGSAADLSAAGVRSPSPAWTTAGLRPPPPPAHLDPSSFLGEPLRLVNRRLSASSQHLGLRRASGAPARAASDFNVSGLSPVPYDAGLPPRFGAAVSQSYAPEPARSYGPQLSRSYEAALPRSYGAGLASPGDLPAGPPPPPPAAPPPQPVAADDYRRLLPPSAASVGGGPPLPNFHEDVDDPPGAGGPRRVVRPAPRSPATSPRFHPTRPAADGGRGFGYVRYDADLAAASAGIRLAGNCAASPASAPAAEAEHGEAAPPSSPPPLARVPYVCQAFSRQHDMKRHAKLHLGIKPHTCRACHKSFARMDALHRHLKVSADKMQRCCSALFPDEEADANAQPAPPATPGGGGAGFYSADFVSRSPHCADRRFPPAATQRAAAPVCPPYVSPLHAPHFAGGQGFSSCAARSIA